MSFYGELDPRFKFVWCSQCEKSIRLSVLDAHQANHKSRPREGAMTPKEVGELFKKSQGEVNHLLRTGRLASFHAGGSPKRPHRWITQEAVAEYARSEMEKGDLRMMDIITKKKRPQNWMPMPEKKIG